MLFKIYHYFIKSSDKNNGSYTEKYRDHIPCSFAYKVVCIDNKFSIKVVLYRGKDTVYRFIEAIINEYDYYKKMIKKHFNKNLIMSAEEGKRFQLSNNCWICWMCDKLFDVGKKKEEIIVMDQKNIEVQHIGIVILTLNLVKKFL